MPKPKKRGRLIRRALAAITLYLCIGGVAPFMGTPTVSAEFLAAWHARLAAYLAQTASPDRAMIVEDNTDALDARIRLIEAAEERIWFSSYFFAADQSCRDITAALYAAAQRGVEIRLLGDGMMSPLHMAKDPIYYALAALPNVEIRMYNPPSLLKPWTFNGRLHDKLLLVDEKLLLCTGRNVSDVYLGGYESRDYKYDRDIILYNTAAGRPAGAASSVLQGALYFETLWQTPQNQTYYTDIPRGKQDAVLIAAQELQSRYAQMQAARPELFAAYDYQARTYACARSLLLFGSTSIMHKEPQVWQQIIDLVATAEEGALVQTPYAVLSKPMQAQLAEQAERIPLTLYTNSFAGAANFFAAADFWRTRGGHLALWAELYEFQNEYSAHGKSLVLDGQTVIVGSFNFDIRSAHLDTETMVAVHCPELAAQLTADLTGPRLMPNRVEADGGYGADPPYEPLPLLWSKRLALAVCSVIVWPLRFLI